MSRSDLLEREAEARRLELTRTFDELRARTTPGNMLNQFVDLASDSGGADLLRNLRTQSVNNPLALGLVGAGLAWLMMSGREPPARRRLHDPSYDPAYDDPGFGDVGYDEMAPSRTAVGRYFTGARERAGDALSGAQHLMSDTAHQAGDAVSGAVGGVRSGLSGAAQMASDMASMASGAAGSIASTARSATGAALDTAGDSAAAIGSATSAMSGRTMSGVRAVASGTASTSRDAFDLARDQPLIIAGLGIALGAAMGAVFRSTERERQLMGEASDNLRERTHALASRKYDESRTMAGAIYDELQHRMQQQQQQPSGSSTDAPVLRTPESRHVVRLGGRDDDIIDGPAG